MSAFPRSLPTARTPDAMAAPPLRWGVLGTGWIAERFVGAVSRSTRQVFTAVASRDAGRGAAFAAAHDIPRAFSSYGELVASDEVDVVYVATPHPAHLECALLALAAGKHVLVEKPLGLSAHEARQVAALAERNGLFCMEALWTMFLPKFDVVRQLVEDGALGTVRSVHAEYGEYFTPDHRIFRQELAGGPLLDLGTYPVSFATMVLGEPAQVLATGQRHESGVNGQLAAILADRDGNEAVVHTTLYSSTPTIATIAGDRSVLVLDGPFYQQGDMVLREAGGTGILEYRERNDAHAALYYEAAEVARVISAGGTQSPLRTLADSIVTLGVMDEIRRQVGIRFDCEG